MTSAATSFTGAGWRAELALAFDSTPIGTRLASRRHTGPLVVQRPLYPEGADICHAIVVHPPGGIAGGDSLAIDVTACDDAHAVMTTPGASKFYKSAGREATQCVRLIARERSRIEWLPQETIVFDRAEASMELDIDVADDAAILAWEITTLGREAMGEHFAAGRLRTRASVRLDGRCVLRESGDVAGGSPWLDSPVGWRGARACGTFFIAGAQVDDATLAGARASLEAWTRVAAVSRVGSKLLVARYLGVSAAQARAAFAALWAHMRPAALRRTAVAPRIWAT